MRPRSEGTARSRGDEMVRTALCVMVGMLVWTAWLSWGFDGSYPVWQVAGCAVTAAAIVGAASQGLDRRGAVATVALPVALGITVAWTWWAAQDDVTGTYLVGTLLLAVGSSVGLALVALLTSGRSGAAAEGDDNRTRTRGRAHSHG